MGRAGRLARFHETDLYVVITEAFCGGRRALEILDDVLAAGAGIVQFREKGLEDGELYERGLAFRERTHNAGALLMVDDRVDVALAIGADGVHLGSSDLPCEAARRIAPELIIGASSHSLDEALAAEAAGADYVNIGPIFPTQTKTADTEPLGPEMIETIAPYLSAPFTVMGGINTGNIDEVLRRGARHVAVVTAVTQASDVRAATAELRRMILSGRR